MKCSFYKRFSTFPYIPQKASLREKSFSTKVLDTVPNCYFPFRLPFPSRNLGTGKRTTFQSEIVNGVRPFGIYIFAFVSTSLDLVFHMSLLETTQAVAVATIFL